MKTKKYDAFEEIDFGKGMSLRLFNDGPVWFDYGLMRGSERFYNSIEAKKKILPWLVKREKQLLKELKMVSKALKYFETANFPA